MFGRQERSSAADFGLLALRMTVGGLLAGHGAQKLFGAFGGYGVEGTAGWLGSMGMKPPKVWAYLAGGSEFGSGVAMALGLFTPIGAVSAFAPMAVAWNKAHAGKPIWVTAGGAELVLTNIAAAGAVALAGPGRYSLDEALGIRVPAWLTGVTLGAVAVGVAASIMTQPEPSQEQSDQAGGELQAEGEGGEAGTATALGA